MNHADDDQDATHRRRIPRDVEVVAQVVSSGALRHAPRRLQVRFTCERVEVRDAEGRLTFAELVDFDVTEQPSSGAGSEGELLPDAYPHEGVAMQSIESMADWAGAPVPAPVSSGTYELQTEYGTTVRVVVDRATGVVLRAWGDMPTGNFELWLDRMEVRRTPPATPEG